mmetsp:Transcript_42735/g.51310  ORF Transcript_42735/g.51310 Transcript_42735/m.51310 type:complete len:81 (-) Transcript_42735:68-310(-)
MNSKKCQFQDNASVCFCYLKLHSNDIRQLNHSTRYINNDGTVMLVTRNQIATHHHSLNCDIRHTSQRQPTTSFPTTICLI